MCIRDRYQPVELAVLEYGFPQSGAALVPHIYGVLLQPRAELDVYKRQCHEGVRLAKGVVRPEVEGVRDDAVF